MEKTDLDIPTSNLDVSNVFWTDNDMSPFHSHEATYRLLRFIDSFKTVHTNRLHICIPSLLLRKNVHFYDNSYGKNAAVFEFSLKSRFSALTWHG